MVKPRRDWLLWYKGPAYSSWIKWSSYAHKDSAILAAQGLLRMKAWAPTVVKVEHRHNGDDDVWIASGHGV